MPTCTCSTKPGGPETKSEIGEWAGVITWFTIVSWPAIMRKFVNSAPVRILTVGRSLPDHGPDPAQLTSFMGHIPAGISHDASESSNSIILRPCVQDMALTSSAQSLKTFHTEGPPGRNTKRFPFIVVS